MIGGSTYLSNDDNSAAAELLLKLIDQVALLDHLLEGRDEGDGDEDNKELLALDLNVLYSH